MRLSECWKYCYEPNLWKYRFLQHSETIQPPKVQLWAHKWYNPFVNMNVVRDVMKYYGPANAYIREKGFKNVLDLGSAFGVGTWLLNGDGVTACGVDIADFRLRYSRQLFPEIEFILTKEGERLDRKFDAVVMSYMFPPDSDEFKKIADYSDTYIFMGTSTGGKGGKIGRDIRVLSPSGGNDTNYGFVARYNLSRLIGYAKARGKNFTSRETRKMMACSKCCRLIQRESLQHDEEGKIVIKCAHCGTEKPGGEAFAKKIYGLGL